MYVVGWIYPVGAHWEWGADGWLLAGKQYTTTENNPRAVSFVEDGGIEYKYHAYYQDFAGSGVVHIMGAFAGLAAMIILGPRSGLKRSFRESPAEKPIPHSLPVDYSLCIPSLRSCRSVCFIQC
jgi:ammonia channel protein AmtB